MKHSAHGNPIEMILSRVVERMESLVLQRFTLGPLETNCYIISDSNTQEAVVIDPGMEPEPLLEAILDLRVTNILLTHGHFDHIGGVAPLHDQTKAQIWIHELEKEWLTDPMKNGSAAWLEDPITSPAADHFFTGGETLTLLGHKVQVLFTPGHSPGHVSFHWGAFVISGDALFAGSIGRTDLEGGDHDTLIESIHRELLSLPDETVLLPGHGPQTTIGDEKRWNPFLAVV